MRSFCIAKASLIFSTKNFSVFGNKVVKHLTSWPLNELVKLTMLWTTGPWCLLKCILHLLAWNVNEPQRVHVNFTSDSNVVYTSIHIRKIKFIAYIYNRFSQNLDEKSNMSAKIEAVKYLHAVFLLTVEQRRRPIRLEKAKVYLGIIDVAWLDVVIGNIHVLHYAPMVCCRAFQ